MNLAEFMADIKVFEQNAAKGAIKAKIPLSKSGTA